MAPRPQARRSSRDRILPPADQLGKLPAFQKPNLPILQGTPSSRRQYSYGSPMEPPPARHTRRGATGNLAAAVQGALTSHGHGEEIQVLVDPRPQRQPSRLADVREDDVDESEPDEEDASHIVPDTEDEDDDNDGNGNDDNDLDDARSFDMEDDYYDGATIDSVNGEIPIPPMSSALRPLAPLPNTINSAPRPRMDVSRSKNGLENVDVLPFAHEHDELDLGLQSQQSQPTHRQPNGHAKPRTSMGSSVQSRDPTALATPPETDSQLSQEAEGAGAGPSGPSFVSRREGFFQTRQSGTNSLSTSTGTLDQSLDPRQLTISSNNHRADFFGRKAPDPPRSPWLSPFRSDRGDTRDVRTPEPEDLDLDLDAQLEQDFFRQRHGSPDSAASEELLDYERTSWSQYLDPSPHLNAAWCSLMSWLDSVFGPITQRLSRLWADLPQDYLITVGSTFIYIIAAMVALVTALTLSSVAYDSLPSELPSGFTAPTHFPVSLPSLSGVTNRIGSYIPSLTWPTSKDDDFNWHEMPGLSGSDDRRLQKMEEWLRDLHRELRRMRDSSKMHAASVKKLESVVPKLVHMTLKDGKPVVAQEFWHAIRDLIREDDSFLTLRKQGGGGGGDFDVANKQQWKSLVAKMAEDPAFASKLDGGLQKAERKITDNIERKLPAFWDSWVASNENKIELVKKHSSTNTNNTTGGGGGGGGGGIVVTREEFLDHLKHEFAAHRAEIKAELGELQPRLEKLVESSIALSRDEDALPSGLAKTQVEELVKTLVAKTMADMNLEALARGRIYAHLDQDLKNEINFFGPGAGASIIPRHTSPTYAPGLDDIQLRGPRVLKPLAPIHALAAWHDDGDCWCGARSLSKRGTPHDVTLEVQLGHSIIPQHIVVEHVLPGATTDPGARPRDIEVYAAIEDPTTRGRVQDFAAAHLPEDTDGWDYSPPKGLGEVFVKIGQFVYEGAERHDGVHVHHLSTELVAMGAETDRVIVRATSNYGAKKHTCFYRLRLYGQLVVDPLPVSKHMGWMGWRRLGRIVGR